MNGYNRINQLLLGRYVPFVVSGILLGIAFPPLPLGFLILVAWVPMLSALEAIPSGKGRGRKVFLRSYITLFIWNIIGCYWLVLTALSAPDLQEAIISFIAGLAAIALNPVVMAVIVWAYERFRHQLVQKGFSVIGARACFIFFWLGFEYLHFRWDLSWSWLTLGHAFCNYIYYIQYIEFTGVSGLSCIILISNVWILNLIKPSKSIIVPDLNKLAIWVFVIGLPLPIGWWLLDEKRSVFQPVGTIEVKVIQPNIDPYYKFGEMSAQEQINRLAELTQAGIAKQSIKPDLVVMPETAIPTGLTLKDIEISDFLAPLRQLTSRFGFDILSGFTEVRIFEASATVPPNARISEGFYYDFCNSAVLIGKQPPVSYQKRRLVPLVERAPFLETFSFFKYLNIDLGGGFGSLGKGTKGEPFVTNKQISVAPLICYESIFAELGREFVEKGAQLLCIITNDGWWKQSSGHLQHAAYATLRAVETRRCIARSANTGISLFINNRGEVIEKTRWWEATAIQRKLALYDQKTFFVTYGDWIGFVAACLLAPFFVGAVIGISILPIRGYVNKN